MSEAAVQEFPAAVAERRRRLRGFAALWATPRRAALVAAGVAALVYLGTLWDRFAYDDVVIVAGDPRVREFQLLNLLQQPYWAHEAALAIYRPLTSLSFALDWAISRGSPWFFHAVNLAEHVGVTVLVFFLLARLFRTPAAFLGALLFAVHPVHVEAVANVVGRAEMLSALFYVGAILVRVRGNGTTTLWNATVVALLYALALLAKESSATLPAALVLVDFALGRWRFRRDALLPYLRRALPLLLLLAVVLAGFIALRLHVLGRLTPSIVDPTFDEGMPPGARVMTALQAWPVYARLLFFPRTLLADYGPRIMMPITGWNLLSLSGLAILLLLIVAGWNALQRGAGRTALGLLWFPVTVLPVSNLLFPIGIMVAERTLYLPMLAVSVGAAALVEWSAAHDGVWKGLPLAAAAVLVALAVRTITRVPVWDSTDKVFYALAADRPDSFRASWHLARIARVQKKVELEMARYQRALALWPYRKALVFEVIKEAIAHQRTAQARTLAAFAAGRWPDDVDARRYLAATSLDLGDTATARSAVRAGLALSPRDSALVRMAQAILVGGAAPRVDP